jgi:hypothetical protein
MFITEAVAEIAENRAAIEQVKGILMMVYRIDAEAAFDLLRWRSQDGHVSQDEAQPLQSAPSLLVVLVGGEWCEWPYARVTDKHGVVRLLNRPN